MLHYAADILLDRETFLRIVYLARDEWDNSDPRWLIFQIISNDFNPNDYPSSEIQTIDSVVQADAKNWVLSHL